MAPYPASGMPQPASPVYDLHSLAGAPPLHAGLPAGRRPGEPLDSTPRPDHRGVAAERPGYRRPPLQSPLAARHRGVGRMDLTMTGKLSHDLARWRSDTPGCDNLVHLNNAGAALVPR